MKQQIKTIIRHLTAHAAPISWRLKQDSLLILMYHRMLPREDERYLAEQPGMIVEPETFRMHLQVLKRHFEPIMLGNWVRAVQSGQPVPRCAVAITFDDGWADNYDYAFPILKEENFPASIFLVSDMVSTNRTFWPEQLMQLIITASKLDNSALWADQSFAWLSQLGVKTRFPDSTPTVDELDTIVCATKKLTEDVIYERLAKMQTLLTDYANAAERTDILTWAQIEEMAQSGLVEFGSHTCNHIRMSHQLDEATLAHEIVNSKRALESKLISPIEIFCYPNGDVIDSAAALVKQHYQAAITTQRGWNSSTSDLLHLKRMAIHNDMTNSEVAFLSRISGWI